VGATPKPKQPKGDAAERGNNSREKRPGAQKARIGHQNRGIGSHAITKIGAGGKKKNITSNRKSEPRARGEEGSLKRRQHHRRKGKCRFWVPGVTEPNGTNGVPRVQRPVTGTLLEKKVAGAWKNLSRGGKRCQAQGERKNRGGADKFERGVWGGSSGSPGGKPSLTLNWVLTGKSVDTEKRKGVGVTLWGGKGEKERGETEPGETEGGVKPGPSV